MKKVIKTVAINIAMGVIGGAVMAGVFIGLRNFGLGFIYREDLDPVVEFLLLMGSVFLAMILHTIIHELGHVVFGKLTGYEFLSYRIFSFSLQKTKQGYEIKRLSIPGTAGQALMKPPALVDGKMPYVWYNLGGVLFNLLLIIVSFGINVLCDHYVVRFIFTMSIGMGLFMGIINIFPYSEKGMTDGCNLLKLHRYPEKIKYLHLQLEMVADLADGKCWEEFEIPEDLFDIEENEIDSFTFIPYLCGINKAYAEKDFKKAGEYIDVLYRNKKQLNKVHQYIFAAEKTFLELIGENRKEIVDEAYTDEVKKFMKALKHEVSSWRVQMAYAYFYKHDSKKAMEFYEKGMAAVKNAPYKGDAMMEVSILTYVKERIEQQREEAV